VRSTSVSLQTAPTSSDAETVVRPIGRLTLQEQRREPFPVVAPHDGLDVEFGGGHGIDTFFRAATPTAMLTSSPP
jgi:hypothetical protein